ncbi:hypothetical protein BDA99DRAFT_63366 [Phascolomyces articulosus]|uniref:Uncharacterized protein n=1 Tax=Phascolomyces articulosus TaxID=60185 RepID=A0AAD5PDS1_9FUNG|nr:hypothetical protein BDA99DRAFT_63366 [Phascolomyces articulosus]
MQTDQSQNLTQLVDGLSKQLHNCLEKILVDPSQSRDEVDDSKSLDGQLLELKATVLNLERNFKEIRLQALSDRKLAVQESVELLKRDIELKKSTIKKYSSKLEQWDQALPILEEKSRQVLKHRTDGKDFDEPVQHKYLEKKKKQQQQQSQQPPADDEEEDDDDEDAEFEEV